jgi:hypothetical protein
LRSEEVLGEQLLEETDGSPGGTDGAGYEGGVAKDSGGEAVKCRDRSAVEGFVGWEVEDKEDRCKEAG